MNPKKKSFAQEDKNETVTEEATEGAKNSTEEVVSGNNDNAPNATNATSNTTASETKPEVKEDAFKAEYKKTVKVPTI